MLVRQHRRRAHPPRDLPSRLRDHRAGEPALDGDVLLQPDQWHLRRRESLAPDRELLKEEWGHQGLVVSDWGAVNDRVAGLAAGLELEMPGGNPYTDAEIVEAVRSGRLGPAVLDAAVERILTLYARVMEGRQPVANFDVAAHHALARRAAAEGAVLLRNEGGALPLPEAGRIAFLGGFATAPRYQGGGSSHIRPTRLETAHEAALALLEGPGPDRLRPRLRPRLLGSGPAAAGGGAHRRSWRRRGRGLRGAHRGLRVGGLRPDPPAHPRGPPGPDRGGGRGAAAHRGGALQRLAGGDALAGQGRCGVGGLPGRPGRWWRAGGRPLRADEPVGEAPRDLPRRGWRTARPRSAVRIAWSIARACSWATGTSTPRASNRSSPSASVCPTRPSSTPTCASIAPAFATTSPWACRCGFGTAAPWRARRSCSSTSATSRPAWPGRRRSSAPSRRLRWHRARRRRSGSRWGAGTSPSGTSAPTPGAWRAVPSPSW